MNSVESGTGNSAPADLVSALRGIMRAQYEFAAASDGPDADVAERVADALHAAIPTTMAAQRAGMTADVVADVIDVSLAARQLHLDPESAEHHGLHMARQVISILR